MIDIHSHIINNIDDGSKNLEMSLDMLKLAVKTGTKKIIATPHFYQPHFEFEFEEVKKRIDTLKKETIKNNIDIEIYYGQEVYWKENLHTLYKENRIGTLNNSKYMLIEFPMMEFDNDIILNGLYELMLLGITPIIAHPERYKPFIRKPERINDFIKEGCLFQLNSGSIIGKLGSDAKKLSKIYLDNNIYSFWGSDAHNMNSRSTNMSVSKIKLTKEQLELFYKNAEDMINNKDVKFRGSLIKKKSIFNLFIK